MKKGSIIWGNVRGKESKKEEERKRRKRRKSWVYYWEIKTRNLKIRKRMNSKENSWGKEINKEGYEQCPFRQM